MSVMQKRRNRILIRKRNRYYCNKVLESKGLLDEEWIFFDSSIIILKFQRKMNNLYDARNNSPSQNV